MWPRRNGKALLGGMTHLSKLVTCCLAPFAGCERGNDRREMKAGLQSRHAGQISLDMREEIAEPCSLVIDR